MNQPRQIVPELPPSTATNQQVLYALASGTGGFPILNTNDFLAGLEKIAHELDEYYVLGYTPRTREEGGGCHSIKVHVNHKGLEVRYRSGYCEVQGPDPLAGKPEGKSLEQRIASFEPGTIPISVATPYFYTGANVARVNLVWEIPSSVLEFEKEKKELHSEVNVLGVAYREDGAVGARFSDTIKEDLDKKQLKEFMKEPLTHSNTFDVAPGKYTLKIVLSTQGQKFGKVERELVIEPFDGKRFHLSGLALSDKAQPISELAERLDAALLEERTPLVAKGTEFVPSCNNRFKRTDKVALYVEVYEPDLVVNGIPRVGITLNVFDRKTNQQVFTSNTISVNEFVQEGNLVIPVGVPVPVDKFPAGDYRLEVRARDSSGHASPIHTTEFDLN